MGVYLFETFLGVVLATVCLRLVFTTLPVVRGLRPPPVGWFVRPAVSGIGDAIYAFPFFCGVLFLFGPAALSRFRGIWLALALGLALWSMLYNYVQNWRPKEKPASASLSPTAE
jgi:hypothetical protein